MVTIKNICWQVYIKIYLSTKIKLYLESTMKKFLKEFELNIGSAFYAVTFVLAVINVITRYFFSFTFFWAEEVAVGCFVWVIFLGFSYSYRTDKLIGISALVDLFHGKVHDVLAIITNLIVLVISTIMFYFSWQYIVNMTKITAALELPYQLIYTSILVAFLLICIYSCIKAYKLVKKAKSEDKVSETTPNKEG